MTRGGLGIFGKPLKGLSVALNKGLIFFFFLNLVVLCYIDKDLLAYCCFLISGVYHSAHLTCEFILHFLSS